MQQTILDWRDQKLTSKDIEAKINALSKQEAEAVTTLWLSDNRMSVIPECIGKLKNLEVLALNNNQIAVIPECIGKLKNLTGLGLQNNQISVIPECIGKLMNLTILGLQNNRISVIPECIGKLTNLTKLALHDNQISVIPECIGRLAKLTELNLHGNKGLPQSLQKTFGDSNFREFRAALAQHVQETAKSKQPSSASPMTRVDAGTTRAEGELLVARSKIEEMRKSLIDAEKRAEQQRRASETALMQMKSERDALQKQLKQNEATVQQLKREKDESEQQLKAALEQMKAEKEEVVKSSQNEVMQMIQEFEKKMLMLREALEEDHRREVERVKRDAQIQLTAARKLSDDAVAELEKEVHKFRVVEEDLRKRLAVAEMPDRKIQVSDVMAEELQQYKDAHGELARQVRELKRELTREKMKGCRNVEEAVDVEVDRKEVLGKGATAVVYGGLYKGKRCAVKVFTEKSKALSKTLEREVRILAYARHEHLVDIMGAKTKGDELMVVMERMEGGSLSERMMDKMSVGERIRIGMDVARGLSHLHGVGVIHRDVKPQNVLLSGKKKAKLADFGLAKTVTTTMTGASGGIVGTYPYMSPELWEEGETGAEGDVYAYGVLMWELMSGMVAWEGRVSKYIEKRVVSGERPQPPVREPREAGLLIAQCLLQDRTMRPKAEECVELLEWWDMQDRKDEVRKQAIEDCESMRQEAHSDEGGGDIIYGRAFEAGVKMVKSGVMLKGAKVLGQVLHEDVLVAAQHLGWMRSRKGKAMQERHCTRPMEIVFVGKGGKDATCAEIIEMVLNTN